MVEAWERTGSLVASGHSRDLATLVCVGGVMRRYKLRAIQGLVKGTRVTRRCVVESSRCVLGEDVGLAGRPHLIFVVL